jgi:1,2-diacylglycerol 3-alpha-glucosyltransferase
MHIGLVTACYEPVLNGVTRMVTLYKAHFEGAGHKVSVFTLGGQQNVEDEVNVYRSPALPLGSTGYHFALGYSKIAQKALSGVDIIHCHHLIMGLEFARRYGNCPIVFTNHTRYDLYMGAYTRLPQVAADQLFSFVWPMMTSYCDVVIVPSESVRKVMDEFGVACPKVVINNGIDLDRFRKDDSGLIRWKLQFPGGAVPLVYVGRLSPEKNLNTLLEAFAIAVASAPGLVLILIGSGPLEDKLRRQASGLGIGDKLRFCGSVPNAEVPDYLAAAEIFVTASITEVHPLTIIEAMATGLPIAAVMSPGIVDLVIQGATGLLAENSAGSLADAMVSLARDKGRRRLMGAFARQMSHQYDINKTVAKTLNLYHKLIRSKAGTGRHRINRHWADLP